MNLWTHVRTPPTSDSRSEEFSPSQRPADRGSDSSSASGEANLPSRTASYIGAPNSRPRRRSTSHKRTATGNWSQVLANLRSRPPSHQPLAPTSSEERPSARRVQMSQRLQRAARKASIFQRAGNQERLRKMQSASNKSAVFPLLGSAMTVPAYFLQHDSKGNRPPPIIWEALQLSVSDSELSDEPQNHYTFRIELKYGDVKWVVRRRLAEFYRLHYLLTLKHYQGKLPEIPKLANQFSYGLERAKIYYSEQERLRRVTQAALARRQALEAYLLQILKAMNMRVSYELCAFLELSTVSITKDLGWKGKEGFLDQKTRHIHSNGCLAMLRTRRWNSRWILVRDSYFALCRTTGDPYPCDVIFADPAFQVKQHHTPLGHNILHPYRLTISNLSRRIVLRGESSRQMQEWYQSLRRIQDDSPWAKPHRFNSFAPIRDHTHSTWYVDGEQYFYAVSEAILHAKETIFIEDWWLCPDLYLRRPPADNEEFRIDRLLYRKAEEGVQIYIVVYKEVTVSLTINSLWTKRALRSLHPNIHVQRYPDHIPGGTFYWAHHEKIVVIDSNVAFIGGLDLCYGRYDSHAHRLADYSPLVRRSDGPGKEYILPLMFPGQDYNNARIKDFANIDRQLYPLIPRGHLPRMPWHDVHMGMMGPAARDVARHFIQRWNFIKSRKGAQKKSLPLLMPKGEYVSTRSDYAFQGTCRTQILRSSANWSTDVPKEDSICQAYQKLIATAQHFIYIENQFFITSAIDDPGHEVKNQIGRALVERIKRAYDEQTKFRVIVIMPLMPAFPGDVSGSNAATLRLVLHWQYMSISRGLHSVIGQLRAQGVLKPEDYISFYGLRNYDVINWRANQQRPDDMASKPVTGSPAAASTEPSPGQAQLVDAPQDAETPVDHLSLNNGASAPTAAAGVGVNVGHSLATLQTSEIGADSVDPYKAKGNKNSFGGDKAPEYAPTSPQDARLFEEMRRERESQRRHEQFLQWQNAGSAMSYDRTDNAEATHPEVQAQREREYLDHILPANPPINPHPSEEKHKDHYHIEDITEPVLAESGHLDEDEAYVQRMRHESLLATRAKTAHASTANKSSYHLAALKKQPVHDQGHSVSDSDEADYNSDSDQSGRSLTHHLKSFSTSRMGLSQYFSGNKSGGNSRRPSDPRPDPAASYESLVEPSPGPSPAPTAPTATAPAAHHHQRSSLASRLANHAESILYRPRYKQSPAPAQEQQRLASPEEYALEAYPRPPEPAVIQQPSTDLAISEPNEVTKHISADEMREMTERWLEENPDAIMQHYQDVNMPLVNQLVTEQVYVHCKLMIVDDRVVIMGSANINDRSMLGDHDSEIAIIVEDQEMVDSTMDDQPYQVAKFAHSLRTYLCREHLGLLPDMDIQQIHQRELDVIHHYLDKEAKRSSMSHSASDQLSRYSSESSPLSQGKGKQPDDLPPMNEATRQSGPQHLSPDLAANNEGAVSRQSTVPRASTRQSREGQSSKHSMDTTSSSTGAIHQYQEDRNYLKVQDPLGDGFFFNYWVKTARVNAEVYRKVFRCVPDDTVRNMSQYKTFIPSAMLRGHAVMEGATHDEMMEVMKDVHGHLVVMPLNFLDEENLGAAAMSAEYVVPIKVFI
ncbi:hypothetical protein H4R35_005962 [Dimargaris xerosporica]|nr:hypothetical protein H4R35_005962 [Dimargaris xerosporica]